MRRGIVLGLLIALAWRRYVEPWWRYEHMGSTMPDITYWNAGRRS